MVRSGAGHGVESSSYYCCSDLDDYCAAAEDQIDAFAEGLFRTGLGRHNHASAFVQGVVERKLELHIVDLGSFLGSYRT